MTFDEWYEAQQVPYGHEHYEAMKAAWLAARAIDLRGHLAGRNVRPVSGQKNVGTFSDEPSAANLAGPESDARAKMNQRLELIEDRIEISKRFGTNDVPDDGNECAHCGGRTDENGMCLGER